MDADIAYFVTYPCPQCRLELEAEHGGWQGWLRCPSCGTPSLPPEILLGHPATMRRVRGLAGDDDAVLVIDADDPDGASTPDPAALIGEPPSALVSSLRMVFLTGLVISLFILLISFLDDNQLVTGFCGAHRPDLLPAPAPAAGPKAAASLAFELGVSHRTQGEGRRAGDPPGGRASRRAGVRLGRSLALPNESHGPD